MANPIDVNKFNRTAKVNQILSVIKQSTKRNKGADKEKLIAIMCMEWGTSRRTMVEYLKMLIDSDRVMEMNGKLLYLEEGNKQ